MGRPPLKIVPLHRRIWTHLIHGSLGPPESTTQTAARSVKSAVFPGLTIVTDRPHTTLVTITSIYVRSTVMRPKTYLRLMISQQKLNDLILLLFLWPPYGIGQAIIFSCRGFYLLLSIFFFSRLISAVGDWMSTILRHMVWP